MITMTSTEHQIVVPIDAFTGTVPRPLPTDFVVSNDNGGKASVSHPTPDGTQNTINVTITRNGASNGRCEFVASGTDMNMAWLVVQMDPLANNFVWREGDAVHS